MLKRSHARISLVLAVALFTPIDLKAAADELDVVKIEDLTCRTYLKMMGDERDLTAVFLHGYVSALRSETDVNLPAISEANDRIIDTCIDNPGSRLLEVFKASRS